MKPSLYVCCLAAGLWLAACVSTPTLAEQILGTWQTNVNGFDVTMIYAQNEIRVEGFGMNLPYSLSDNVISIDVPSQGLMKATVEIEGDEMTQTDMNSGEVTRFRRKI